MSDPVKVACDDQAPKLSETNSSTDGFQRSSGMYQSPSIDVSGVARTQVDSRGLTQGSVLGGGTVKLTATTGYVVAQAGSQIDVSGAAPVRLDVPNEQGSLGRMVGSDAGALNVFAEEGILLDATMSAKGGSASNRNGAVSIALSNDAVLCQAFENVVDQRAEDSRGRQRGRTPTGGNLLKCGGETHLTR